MASVWADNIEELTEGNDNFRKVLWTGAHSELTLMSIEPGQAIGLELHPDHDQFLRFEAGKAQIKAGPAKDNLNETVDVEGDWACIIPAGTWQYKVAVNDGWDESYGLNGGASDIPLTVGGDTPVRVVFDDDLKRVGLEAIGLRGAYDEASDADLVADPVRQPGSTDQTSSGGNGVCRKKPIRAATPRRRSAAPRPIRW